MVQSSGRMFPRDGVGETAQVLMEYLSFLYGSVNLISGICCPVCAYVLHQHSYLFQIRVVQQKQFGNTSLDRRSKFGIY